MDGPEVDVDDAGLPDPEVAPSAGVAAASALLEPAARERGLPVRRLDPETVVCGDGDRRVLFHGLASSASSKLAHVLCGNDAWLRAYLARHGLPVVPTRLVGADDARFAARAAAGLGYPVRVRLVGLPGGAAGHTANDVESFHACWRAVTAGVTDRHARAIVERRDAGTFTELVVVAGALIGSRGDPGEWREAAEQLAVDAVAALPGAATGTVRLVTVAGCPGPLISTVHPAYPADRAAPIAFVPGLLEGVHRSGRHRPVGLEGRGTVPREPLEPLEGGERQAVGGVDDRPPVDGRHP